ncbi:hypothetical protein AB6A40_008738 [Gnathostoma spinigerum]|uniref:Neurotransmitter-gated ion-channel transmembrane domain-containing protein n=1 Tax=Gnathostoma spinigerum TaxID=75299 RepID=A0ABD6EV17_9BILA
MEEIVLPSYRLVGVCKNITLATTASGSYSRLWVQFIFDREAAFYILQIFVPATLVVFISWISFWISRDSAPSRTVIGTLTILTETHLLTGTNRRLPPVSYIKAVDVYLGFCYLIVVLALVEYACVAYAKKKYDDKQKKFDKKDAMNTKPSLQTPDLLRDARIDECTCGEKNILSIAKPNRCKECLRFKYSRIDVVARVAFPISFFIFNVIYWTILLAKAGWLNSAEEDAREKEC